MKKPTKKEIEKGTRMENEEHGEITKGKKKIAKKIALDHLVKEGMPTYYEELPKMEKKLKSKKKK